MSLTLRRVVQAAAGRVHQLESRHPATADAPADTSADVVPSGANQWASEESVFSAVLASRSFQHLRLLFRVFQSVTGRDIEAVIQHEFSGDLRKGFLSIGTYLSLHKRALLNI